jgi:hypothetical protein
VTATYTLLGVANIGFAVAAQGVVAFVSPPYERLDNFGYYRAGIVHSDFLP